MFFFSSCIVSECIVCACSAGWVWGRGMFVVACVTKTEDYGRGGLWVNGVLMGDGASVSLVRCARCVRPRRFGLRVHIVVTLRVT